MKWYVYIYEVNIDDCEKKAYLVLLFKSLDHK